MEAAFYPRCHSSGSDLDIASKRNSQRAGHVRVLFVRHHPFLIEGCPIYCLCFILYRSSVVFSGANLPLGQTKIQPMELRFLFALWFIVQLSLLSRE